MSVCPYCPITYKKAPAQKCRGGGEKLCKKYT